MKFKHVFKSAFTACALILAAYAPAKAIEEPETRLALFAAQPSAAPGDTVSLAIEFTVKPGWHLYWKNPGDTGFAPGVTWSGAQGVEVGPLRFPAPSTFTFAGMTNYGYLKSFTVLADAALPADARGNVVFAGDLEWLACDDKVCVPESGSVSLSLPIDPAANPGPIDPYFAKAREALPKEADWPGRAVVDEGTFRVQFDVPFSQQDIASAFFFPETEGVIVYEADQNVSWPQPNTIEISVPAQAEALDSGITGVLQLTPKASNAPTQTFALSAAAVAAGTFSAASPVTKLSLDLSLASALGFALIGGLLLNLMPCVFPVLSLKALSLTKSAGQQSQARRDGWLYTAGILVSFAVLAGALLAFRAAGSQLGWGFQLQSPIMVAILAVVLFLIGLNLLGAFEVSGRLANIGQGWLEKQSGAAQSFAAGVLATVVATPCTAPFMASALSFALTQPPLGAMGIFLALGLGLALPFLLLSHSAWLCHRLPRPGAWMDAFKQLMAFPMFGTMLWLLWILSSQGGQDAVIVTLGVCLFFGFAVWAFQRGGKISTAAAALALLIAVFGFKQIGYSPQSVAAAPSFHPEDVFSEAKLAKLIAEDKGVFVYFTADWCITCKANERLALNVADVRDAFAASDIVVLKADFTSRDEKIAKALETFGRAGVPLYLYYKPGGGVTPQELPQILRPAMLIDLVKGASV